MAIFARRLPESKTHKNRSYDLSAGTHELADWVLTIRQGDPHRKNFTCVTYAVQRDKEPVPDVFRFLLAKDDDSGIVYEVDLSKRGGCSCSCTAGIMRKLCKHAEALFDALFVVGMPESREELATHVQAR